MVVRPLDESALRSLSRLTSICRELSSNAIVQHCNVIEYKGLPESCLRSGDGLTGETTTRDVLAATQSTINPHRCFPGTPSDLPGQGAGLSPLWAQEQIGSDLAKQFLDELQRSGQNLHEVRVANVDGGHSPQHMTGRTSVSPAEIRPPIGPRQFFRTSISHGTQVVNLINGRGEYGVGHPDHTVLSHLETTFDGVMPDPETVDRIAINPPDLLNYEIHTLCSVLPDCNPAYREANMILMDLSRQTVVVAAAGNHALDTQTGSSRNRVLPSAHIITVGSSSPRGLVSDFSDEAPDVTILAPSDHYLVTPGIRGRSRQGMNFGGTSGAAPLVTGALANARAILKEFSAAEAKTLLQRTAITTAISQRTRLNGAGILNAYKLVRVAQRLKQRGWPTNRERLLSDPTIYDFAEESNTELQAAYRLLAQPLCSNVQQAAIRLRRAFLLNPQSEAREVLAVLYRSADLPINAEFYENLDSNRLTTFLSQNDPSRIQLGPPGFHRLPPETLAMRTLQFNALMQAAAPDSNEVVFDGRQYGMMGGIGAYSPNTAEPSVSSPQDAPPMLISPREILRNRALLRQGYSR